MKKIIFVIFIFLIACSTQIDTKVKIGNEGFVIGNGSNAVLLTHGLSSSPHEEKQLADYFVSKNFTVYVVRLSGHGTSIQDLDRTTWEEWYSDYKNAYLTLKESKEKVYVGGMSLGGALALKLAEDENVSGVIALAPALILDDSRSNYAWFFKYFAKYSLRNISASDLPYNYDKFSVSSVAESLKLSGVVEKNLNKINAPLFLMQYKNDYRVKPESSQLVYDSVSGKKELNWIDGNGHVMINNVPNETMYFEKIYEFMKKNIISN